MIDIIFILLIHWIADFIFQTRNQANNKSRSLTALLSHTTVYSLCWLILWPILGLNTLWFVGITFLTHTLTDYFTSKLNAYWWMKRMLFIYKNDKKAAEYEHAFWTSIGGDQFLHTAQLIITYNIL